jgi:serine/threonine-protein kinase
MLTARLPFELGGTLRDDLLAIVTEPARPLPRELDAGVRALVESCLSKDPSGRPADGAALARQLRAVQTLCLASRGLVARRS